MPKNHRLPRLVCVQGVENVNRPGKSKLIAYQINRDLNQCILHIWSKFGDFSLNGWWVIARTSRWLPHTWRDGRTHKTDRHRQWQYLKAKTGVGYIFNVTYVYWQHRMIFLFGQGWNSMIVDATVFCISFRFVVVQLHLNKWASLNVVE